MDVHLNLVVSIYLVKYALGALNDLYYYYY